jgi:hypothetical protein
MKRKITLVILIQTLFLFSVRADEGMWLPYHISKVMANMHALGCKLAAEQIYDADKPSIKDAIVHFGGFCTGEIVSSQGLVFTNHHCGYDAISGLSTKENNYLDNGFWAKDFKDEIPAPGLSVSILVYMKDVTDRIQNASDRAAEIKRIKEEATAGNHYRADVKSYFYGNEYYLLVYETFKDIRLVGTPPQNIGKFGGDTDNWMWPRHTGDFSVFRIYASPDNKPAEYNINNVPYKPKHYLPINLKGIQENDFAMIMGFPGRTTRYLTQAGVKNVAFNRYPERAKILKEKLAQWWSEMEKDVNVRLLLSGDYASLANSQKYYEGVMNALKKSPCLDIKSKLEKEFTSWVNADNQRKSIYGNVIQGLEDLYNQNKEHTKVAQYLAFAYSGVHIAQMGESMVTLRDVLSQKTVDQNKLKETQDVIRKQMDTYFESFVKMADQKTFASMLRLVSQNLDSKYWVSSLTSKEMAKLKPTNGDKFDAYAALVYNSSILTDKEKMSKFIEKPSLTILNKDLGIKYAMDVTNMFSQYIGPLQAMNAKEDELMKIYVKGLREFKSDKFFYPDANSTLRVTYGQVKSYIPRDGVLYNWYTTHRGILEKEIPGDPEFDVFPDFSKALRKGDFGKYADKNGDLPVAFICNLDITGGNSGSPVINGNGELIGIAFDGVWEGMVGDLYWEPKQNRTIAVDIRYVMYVIEQNSGSQRIFNEVKVIL